MKQSPKTIFLSRKLRLVWSKRKKEDSIYSKQTLLFTWEETDQVFNVHFDVDILNYIF